MYYFYTNLQATNLLNLKHTYFCAKKQRHTEKNIRFTESAHKNPQKNDPQIHISRNRLRSVRFEAQNPTF